MHLLIDLILMAIKNLDQDIAEINNLFPKLNYISKKNKRLIEGELDICDTKGIYWDTFEIEIYIPPNYPYGVPTLVETSKKIPRADYRHINKAGICCVDMSHELLFQAKQGIRLFDFIKNKAYPFFANQLFYDEKGYYSNGEYKHRFKGVEQFYKERLNIDDCGLAVKLLNYVLSNPKISRNKPCVCGSGDKVKDCHLSSIEFLKDVGSQQLLLDLKEFKKA